MAIADALAELLVAVRPNFKDFPAEVQHGLAGAVPAAEREGRKIGDAAGRGMQQGTEQHTRSIGEKLKGVFNPKVLGAAALAGGSVALLAFGKSSVSAFEDTAKAARNMQRVLGGSVEDASRLNFAFHETGIAPDKAASAMARLEKQMSGKTNPAMKALGITFKDAQGHVKPMADILPQLEEKFSKMENGPKKTALAMQLFGKSGADMLPFLNKGPDKLKEMGKEADKLGLTMSGKNLDAIKKNAEQHKKMDAAMDGLKVTIGKYLYPIMTTLFGYVVKYAVPAIVTLISWFKDKLVPFIQKNVVPILQSLAKVFTNNIVPALKTAGTWIGNVFDYLSKHLSVVKGFAIAVAAVVGPILALNAAHKAFTTASNAAKIVTGLFKTSIDAESGAQTKGAIAQAISTAKTIAHTVAMVAAKVASLAMAAASKAWAAAQWLLNAALDANPIALVVIGIAALIAIVVAIATKTTWFQTIWKAVWDFAKKIFSEAKEFLTKVWHALWTVLKIYFDLYWKPIHLAITVAITVFKAIFTEAKKIVTAIWNALWGAIKTVFVTLWAGIKKVIQVEIDGFKKIFTVVKDAVVAIWNALWGAVKSVFVNLWKGIKFVIQTEIDGFKKIFTVVKDGVIAIWNGIWNTLKNGWNAVWRPIHDGVQNSINIFKSIFTNVVAGIKTIWNGIKDVFMIPVRFVVNSVLDPLISGADFLLDHIGLHIPQIPKLARGGVVPGNHDRDTVPVFATPGEVMVPKNVVSAFGGPHSLMGMLGFSGTPFSPGSHHKGGGWSWNPITTVKHIGHDIASGASKAWNTGKQWVGDVAGWVREGAAAALAAAVLNPLKAADNVLDNFGPLGKHFNTFMDQMLDKVYNLIKGKEKAAPAGTGKAAGSAQVMQWILAALSAMNLPTTLANGISQMIMAESGGNPSAINRTDSNAQAGHPSQGLMQCASLATQILTRRGWLSHDEVKVGDATLGYNPVTGRSEWTTITKVVHYENAPVWRVGHRNWHADVTPNHRWWSDTMIGDRLSNGTRGEFVRTENFGSRHRLRLAAPAVTDGIPGLSIDECAVIGWLQGDGHISKDRDGEIYQSKPGMITKLRALLARFDHTEAVRPPRGNAMQQHVFRLRRADVRDMWKRAELDTRTPEEFVLELSPEQRAAWLNAMIDAEGHRMPGKRAGYAEFVRIAQIDGPLQDAIRLAVFLEGWRPTYSANSAERVGYQPAGVVGMAKPHVAPSSFHEPEILPNQTVWCVKTDLETWTAGLDGQVFLTGNTIPSTFAAYVLPGLASRGITDPIANITAGVRYAISRYGSGMVAAGGNRSASGGYVGYDTGGILRPGLTMAYNGTGRDEYVSRDKGGVTMQNVENQYINSPTDAALVARALEMAYRSGGGR